MARARVILPAGGRTAAGFTGATIGRRGMLIMALGGGLALTGCTGSGRQPTPSSSAPGSPTPTPLPGTVDATATEKDLAQYADALLTRFGKHLDDAEQHLISAIRDAHLAHAAALAASDPVDVPGPTPTSGTSTPASGAGPSADSTATSAATGSTTTSAASGSASPSSGASTTAPSLPKSPARAIKVLRAMELKAATGHRKRTLHPSGPQDQLPWLTLLWGSLASAADSYAQALAAGRDPGADPVQDHRVAVELPDETAAVQNLVEQCYAIIFGYQAALAALSGSAADHARAGLADHRELRDQLSGWLTEHDAKVPSPQAAYRFPVQPTSPSRAAELIGTMEDQLLPYLGQWLAATEDDQRSALDSMITGARNVGYWTSKINIWPGWPVQH